RARRVALDRGAVARVVDDAGVIRSDEGMVPGVHPARVVRPAAVDAGALLRELDVVVDAGGAGALDAVVPRRADGEAGAPRDAVVAVDALLPLGRLRLALVGAVGVLVHSDEGLQPAFAVRARAAAGGLGDDLAVLVVGLL